MDVSFWQRYGKSVVAFLFTLWTVIAPLITGDGRLDRDEWIIFAIAVGNNLLVYIVPLNPLWESGKTWINAVLAALAAAQTVIVDGLQPDDWTIIIGAGLGILLGWYAPAISMNHTTEKVRVTSGFTS
jgi:hypothetical protein